MTICTHHWQIQEARGPTSQGRCANCGEVRDFDNSTDHEGRGNWMERYWQGQRKRNKAKSGRPARKEIA